MDIRSFLKGYFYSCLIATNKKQNPDFGYTEIKLSSVILVTPSGTLEFRINRGISHIDGNLVLPAFEEVGNAENNSNLNADDLIIREAIVEEGPALKRFRPCARGWRGGRECISAKARCD